MQAKTLQNPSKAIKAGHPTILPYLSLLLRLWMRTKAQRYRQKPPWPEGQLDESLGRQATVQHLSTNEHRLEGAIPARSETRGAGVAKQILDKRLHPSV